MRWSYRYAECGGYDCMTAAFLIENEARTRTITIDLSAYGQANCIDPSPDILAEADRDARTICDALNARGD